MILSNTFGCAVLLKGGHLDLDECTDLLLDNGSMHHFSSPRLSVKASHGTGCTLAAALASGLALGKSLPEAVSLAKNYLNSTLATSYFFQGPDGTSIFAAQPELAKRSIVSLRKSHHLRDSLHNHITNTLPFRTFPSLRIGSLEFIYYENRSLRRLLRPTHQRPPLDDRTGVGIVRQAHRRHRQQSFKIVFLFRRGQAGNAPGLGDRKRPAGSGPLR